MSRRLYHASQRGGYRNAPPNVVSHVVIVSRKPTGGIGTAGLKSLSTRELYHASQRGVSEQISFAVGGFRNCITQANGGVSEQISFAVGGFRNYITQANGGGIGIDIRGLRPRIGAESISVFSNTSRHRLRFASPRSYRHNPSTAG